MTHAQRWNRFVQEWQRRAQSQNLKPGTKRYFEARLDFFVGANIWDALSGDANGGPWPILHMVQAGMPTEILFAMEN